MRSITLSTKLIRAFFVCGLLISSMILISGCEPDPYPEDMKYPQRKSILIQDTPDLRQGLLRYPELGVMPQTLADQIYAKVDSLDPKELDEPRQNELSRLLERYYGTPRKPGVAGIKDELQLKAIFGSPHNNLKSMTRDDMLDRLYTGLVDGSKLYRRHCLHCHGVSGNGRGPTAAWVNPHPRDYRRGLFKFKSTLELSRPVNADLYRTLYEGIEGTSMPSFKVLTSRELDALVSYVIHLSMRGEVEFEVTSMLLKDSNIPAAEVPEYFQASMDKVHTAWAEPQLIPVHEYSSTKVAQEIEAAGDDQAKRDAAMKASVQRGYELFHGDGACLACHVNFGRSSELKPDKWGTIVRPRNLTEGLYRGGRRPVDLYYRIYGGIAASGMPVLVQKLQSKPDDVWDLVNFVRALPYKPMLPEELQSKLYPR